MQKKICRRVATMAALAALASAGPAVARDDGSSVPDKSGYTLLHPVPEEWMREMSADRPDKTETPMTVDAGHYQVEMDLVNLTLDPGTPAGGGATRTWEAAPMTLKAGVLNTVDVQLALVPWRHERERGSGGAPAEVSSGFSGVTPRLKWNLVGNDGGPFALALLPFVTVGTERDVFGEHRLEGGLKVPYSFEVPGWELGAMTEVDCLRDESGPGHHWVWVNSVSAGRPIFGPVSLFGELFTSVGRGTGAGWVATADAWITVQVNRRLRLDAGVYVGLTRAADDLHPFLGLTWRY